MRMRNNDGRQISAIGILVLVILLGLTPSVFAQLRKVDQTVYGMDCAPCAYGLQKSLKKIKGVENVKISLNTGKALITLKPGNTVTLGEIQQVVRENGFTPKGAKVIEEDHPRPERKS